MKTTDIEAFIQSTHERAMIEARQAAEAFTQKYFGGSDGGPCGFAWVNVYKIRSNSKLGKALQNVGFRKSYQGGLQQWNKWYHGQSVDAAEHGAVAYAKVMEEAVGEAFYAGSRLD